METTRQLLNELIELGKTQHEISKVTKVPQPTISRILNGLVKSPFARCHNEILIYYQNIIHKEINNE